MPIATTAAPPAADLDDLSLYTNRELSWLEFNQRVLDQATGDHHPLLERVKFLAITASNLDEFFMVRVAMLLKRQRAGIEDSSLGGLSVSQQIAAVRQRATKLMIDQAACWQESLRPSLAHHGHPISGVGRIRRAGAPPPAGVLPRGHFSTADAARVRSGPPVSADLQPEQESRGRGPSSRADQVCARQSPGRPAAIRSDRVSHARRQRTRASRFSRTSSA